MRFASRYAVRFASLFPLRYLHPKSKEKDVQNHRTTFDKALEDVRITRLVHACIDVPFDQRQYRRHVVTHAFCAWLLDRRRAKHHVEHLA